MVAGLNDRGRRTLRCLASAATIAGVNRGRLVVAGDIYDKATPDARLVAGTRQALGLPDSPDDLLALQEMGGYQPVVVSGNHDAVSNHPSDHALGTLGPACIVAPGDVVWDRSMNAIFAGYQPGVRGLQHLEYIRASLLRDNYQDHLDLGSPVLLVIHQGIIDGDTPPWLREASDAVELTVLVEMCRELRITHVAAGNWHERKLWVEEDVEVLQVGALCPTGWDNPGLTGYGTVARWSPETGFDLQETPGPRFVHQECVAPQQALSWILSQSEQAAPACDLFVRVKIAAPLVKATQQLMSDTLMPPNVVAVEVVPLAREAAQEVEEAQREVPTLEQALRQHGTPEQAEAALSLLHEAKGAQNPEPVVVQSIELDGAGHHQNTRLELPERGLVLLTGHNGSGKSTLVQGIPMVLWGKPATDRPPLWTSEKPRVALQLPAGRVERRPKNKPVLTWTGSAEFDRKRDAQTELESRYGTLQQWKRQCLLDGGEQGYLTTAGPTDRRRILTEMAGLEGLDQAHEAARLLLRTAEKEAEVLARDLLKAETQVQVLRDVPSPPELLPLEDHQEREAHLQAAVDDAETELRELGVKQNLVFARRTELGTLLKQAAARKARQEETGVCSACGQPVAHRAEHIDLDDRTPEWLVEDERASVHQDVLASEKRQLTQEVAQLKQSRDKVREVLRDHQFRLVEQARYQETAGKLAASVKVVEQLLPAARAAQVAVEHAKAVEQLLSPRGPRGEVLEGFCQALGLQASQMLREAYGAEAWVRVEVTPKGVEMSNWLGGSPSRGELRRIDIALALAGLQLAEAVSGRRGSTLMCDEVLESLDQEGVVGTLRILRELARHRCVVLVTHTATDEVRAHVSAEYHATSSKLERIR